MTAQAVTGSHGLEPSVRMECRPTRRSAGHSRRPRRIDPSRYTLGLDTTRDRLVMLDVEGFPLERHWYSCIPVGKHLPVGGRRSFMDFVRRKRSCSCLDQGCP